jgi:catechol O-methyltransferase
MNIGPEKGAVLDQALRERRPALCMEWGGYLGYSAIRIGRLLQEWGGRLISLEFDPARVARATRLIKHAGLEGVVSFKAGPASDSLPLIAKELGPGKHVDLIFLDHVKDLYLPDLRIAEAQGLVVKGSVLVADNVIFPGCPDYLLYVRDSKNGYTSKHYPAHLEYSSAVIDGIEVSIKQ